MVIYIYTIFRYIITEEKDILRNRSYVSLRLKSGNPAKEEARKCNQM